MRSTVADGVSQDAPSEVQPLVREVNALLDT
jgi:hypothetical protein